MFTGIVTHLGKIVHLISQPNLLTITIAASREFQPGLALGNSVSVNGVCLTLTHQEILKDDLLMTFDIIEETLSKTTLSQLQMGHQVHLERSLQFGGEVGGHLLSGHVMTQGRLVEQTKEGHLVSLVIGCDAQLKDYIFDKGYIAVDGVSLTVKQAWLLENECRFQICLIPETRNRTLLVDDSATVSRFFNIEPDSQTVAIVETTKAFLREQRGSSKPETPTCQ